MTLYIISQVFVEYYAPDFNQLTTMIIPHPTPRFREVSNVTHCIYIAKLTEMLILFALTWNEIPGRGNHGNATFVVEVILVFLGVFSIYRHGDGSYFVVYLRWCKLSLLVGNM